MPYKDPEKKRAYDAKYRADWRADKILRGNGTPPKIGICYMCFATGMQLQIDHCHVTEDTNRGYLCGLCNRLEGHLRSKLAWVAVDPLSLPIPSMDETLPKKRRSKGVMSPYEQRQVGIQILTYLKYFGRGHHTPEALARIEELKVIRDQLYPELDKQAAE